MLFPEGVEQSEYDTDCSLQISAKVKNVWSLISLPPVCVHGGAQALGQLYLYISIYFSS